MIPHAIWEQAIFRQKVRAEDLAARILADQQAALLYYGLYSLDEETLAYVAGRPSLIRTIHRRHAAPFAAFADGIAVDGGRVRLPGGASAAARWETLVGASAANPEAFITKLLSRDGGRLAWLFDTIGRLDAPRQAFAIGSGRDDLKSLYAGVASFDDGWRINETPFRRLAPVDPTTILSRVAVTPDGQMAPPRERAFWQAVFGARQAPADRDARTSRRSDEGPVTAAWLVERFRSIPWPERRTSLESVLFAQRLVADATRRSVALDPAELAEVVSGFGGRRALVGTLERLGFADARDYQQAAAAARTLTAGVGGIQYALRLATFQGALALVARLHGIGVIGSGSAQDLCRRLFPLAAYDETRYPGELADWIESALFPTLPKGPTERPATFDARLREALAGLTVARPTPTLTWEDRRYRVDIAAGEYSRLSRILRRQRGSSLDGVLEFHRLIRRMTLGASSPDNVRTEASRLLEFVETLVPADQPALFGFEVSGVRDTMLSQVRQVAEGRSDRWTDEARRSLGTGLAVVLADALATYVYAVALADPEASLLLGGNPARRHDFGTSESPHRPWLVATVERVGAASGASGSLLALERALAQSWLRATTIMSPAAAPLLWDTEAQGLGETVAASNPFVLTDQQRDTLVAALRRGRQRLAEAAGHPDQLDQLAVTAGVEGWRRRLIRSAASADPASVARCFSLCEVLGFGLAGPVPPDLHAWGASTRNVDGSLGPSLPLRLDWKEMAGHTGLGLLSTRMADPQLRIAEWLAELDLPAVLAPGILSYAMWDLVMNTQMTDRDDWLSVTRAAQALSAERMADHVSALTSGGPLVPLEK